MSYLTQTMQATNAVPTPLTNKTRIFSKTNGIYYKGSDGVEEKLLDDHDIAHIESILNMSVFYGGGI